MDRYVAVRVGMQDGSNRYFLALGRVFDPVDAGELLRVVKMRAEKYELRGSMGNVSLCELLREAADSGEAPFFFEALCALGHISIPTGGKKYRKWVRKTRKAMQRGECIYYCGGPPLGLN